MDKVNVRKKLIDFWNKEIGDEIKAERAARSLQRQAEIDVANAQECYENAKADFEKSKMDAKDDWKGGFKKIAEKHRIMSVEKKAYDDIIAIYESLFEEKPRLLE
jgi:hypothetical protein